jgi:glycosyltransferase involved in cell wall biosynthesis
VERRKIAIVTDWYPSPERPGLGTFVLEQARAVATLHDVAVIVSPASSPPVRRAYEVDEGEEYGLRTLRVRFRESRLPKLGFALRLAGTVAALQRLRKRAFVPDVLHAHIYGPGFVAVLLGRAFRTPVVVSEQFSGIALGTVRGVDRRIARYVYRHADVVCPASEDLRRRIEEYGATRLRVVPNPVDTSVFHPGPPRRDAPVRALAVGAVQETKGISELLAALAQARAHAAAVPVDVVGDGPGREHYRERAEQLGLAGLVRFRGALPHREVAAAMRDASFLVHASHWENLPNVLIEALACGLPVVATDVGGVPEIVRPDEGILVPPRDVPALARAIGEMRERCREFDPERLSRDAGARFGADVVARLWTEVYEDVVAARRNAA